jgi:hypothetical protein
MITIISENTDSFNLRATRNDIVLIDTNTSIVIAKLNFTYTTPIVINPIVSLQPVPPATFIIR